VPGVFGFVSRRPLADAPGLARAMGALLSSDERQRSTAVCGEAWALGATFTPGLELDPAPAPSPAGWSVVTGEVYPSGDAPASPPASARPALVEALGAGEPARLASVNGQFAGALLDPARGVVSLACDRHALQALYWVQRDDLFAFASELKALLAVPGVGRDLDPEGLAAFLMLGEHFSDTTLLAGVRIAPAASWVRSDGGPPRTDVWWQVRYPGSLRAAEEEDAAREAGRRFRRAVERQTTGPARVGVPLSGGLDSRICLAAIPAERARTVTSFTWGDPGCLDRVFARATARACGTRHRDLDYRYDALVAQAARGAWIVDGLAGATDFHVLPYLDDLAADADVVLNGFAGDALLGGNFHWRRVRGLAPEAVAHATFAKRNDVLAPEETTAILHPGARGACADLRATYARAFLAHQQEDALGTLDAFLLDSRVRRWTSFGTQLLRARVVSRAPFYDADFFDLVATVPPDWRTDHRFYRKVLLSTFPAVARIGWQTTGAPAAWPPALFRPVGTVARRGLGALERLTGGRLRSPFPVARLAKAYRGRLAAPLHAALFEGAGPHWEVVERRAGERIWQELQAGRDDRAKTVGVLLTLRHFLAQARGDRAPPPLPAARVEVTPAGAAGAARAGGAA
jgi:asparagine synthetase B (glutamine-hydrolysing)